MIRQTKIARLELESIKDESFIQAQDPRVPEPGNTVSIEKVGVRESAKKVTYNSLIESRGGPINRRGHDILEELGPAKEGVQEVGSRGDERFAPPEQF